MTRKLHLTLSCGLYELTRALIDREVEAKGIEFTFMTDDPVRIYSLRRRNEADIAEFNAAKYLLVREQGAPLIALPIYPHRRFRHGYYWVNTAAGISRPADLIGKHGGIVGRTPAAGVWMRGILQDHHGVPVDAVTWHENAHEPMDESQPEPEPNTVTEATLLDGEVDVLLTPRVPLAVQRGDPRVARLFPDHVTQSIAYYQATGIFPIMHVVTVREALLEQHPWVAESIYEAFEQAKLIGYQRVSNPRLTPLAFFEAAWEQQRELLGPDPWEYGLGDANRRNLQTLVRYAREQGWTTSEPPIANLFAAVG
jgi:4,5-dihydroxyphthalate decarboxylase